MSLCSPLQLSLTVSKIAWLNCIWESHTWSGWNMLPKYHPAYRKREDCISFCSSASWIPKPLAAWEDTLFAQALSASDNLQIQNINILQQSKLQLHSPCKRYSVAVSALCMLTKLLFHSLFIITNWWQLCQLMAKSIWKNFFYSRKPDSSSYKLLVTASK